MINKVKNILIGPYLFTLFIISVVFFKIKRSIKTIKRKKFLDRTLKNKLDDTF